MPTSIITNMTQYTRFPPNRLYCCVTENSEEAVNGANTRMVLAIVCPIPFMAPNELTVGAESLKKTKIQPGKQCQQFS